MTNDRMGLVAKAVKEFEAGYTMEGRCARMVARHRDQIRVRKPALSVANLSRIVTAFLRLSNRKGFHATSLRDLARESGLSMGGLYSYFTSKDDLLLMVLEEVAATMSEALAAVPEDVERNPRLHLRWLIDTHIRLTEAMQPWFVFAFMEAKSFPNSARQAAVNSEQLAEAELAVVFRRGIAAGMFRVEDPDLLASLTKPLLQDWYVKRSKYRKRGIGINRYVDQVIGLIESAVLKDVGSVLAEGSAPA